MSSCVLEHPTLRVLYFYTRTWSEVAFHSVFLTIRPPVHCLFTHTLGWTRHFIVPFSRSERLRPFRGGGPSTSALHLLNMNILSRLPRCCGKRGGPLSAYCFFTDRIKKKRCEFAFHSVFLSIRPSAYCLFTHALFPKWHFMVCS